MDNARNTCKSRQKEKYKNILNNNKTRSAKQSASREYTIANKDVRNSARRDKRAVDKLTTEAEEAARANNIKALYDNIKLLIRKYQKGRRPVKSKEGKTLNTHKEQMKRWVEHFKDVLNQDPPDKLKQVEKRAAETGLSINHNKTKVLKSKTKSQASLIVNTQALEEVESFTYLGSVGDNLGSSDKDVKIRSGKTRTAFNMKTIWKARHITLKTKIRLFNSNVNTILLYGAET
ncbi:Hypothetical predicted protein [Mytilus galloprovincialis]|uniref:DUF6451 domain-containing protein n=1 Tax=Mytilus galloprovincialis TaxID=29158 RepID=A0A8B6ERC5_MYTGA|nr:Hypothetical predicted protein [Mytilus galloprovincialis]